ncbi:MAG TPA: glutamate synthase subunit beta [Bryobacteraceae bacterium]|nr:glutamate synthase subunit beta [Bryobacteraceae bacterium]
MGKTTGFLEHVRETPLRRPTTDRIKDYLEVYQPFVEESARTQGARCMDCGVPFCHTGCPLNNLIPDWNDLVYQGRWKEAARQLHATNNFPEFTGRLCPAPCEAACVLGINEPPVTIKHIEQAIADRALGENWIAPEPAVVKTGNRVAVVGSGPAGLAAAQQLARAGHAVTLFEKADRIGGLLRYGIPNFKMEKRHIDRRVDQMRAEGVEFITGAHIGEAAEGAYSVETLRQDYDAVLLALGAETPRDLPAPGRELSGIHFAMDFLPQQNRRCEGDTLAPGGDILARGKRVVIIGGGDTGADCLGTCHRHGALSVMQFELLPKPPETRAESTPWPLWPMQLRVESSHEEGGLRDWSVSTVRFIGDEQGRVRKLQAARVGPAPHFTPAAGSEFEIEADLVLLAMGFTGPVKKGLVEQLGVQLDTRGNIATDENHMSSLDGVFAAGDVRRGQSLIVWAIAEGRKAAAGINTYLTAK